MRLNRADTSVISPSNDAESKTIVAICRRLDIDVRVSVQPWGATLDREPQENLMHLRKDVVIVEMPAPDAEEKLAAAGYRIHVVDHHAYPNLGIDRRKPASSLEQVAELIGYDLSRWELGVAINDRAYIYGLLDAGYTIEEILSLRKFDLQCQGVPAERIEAVKEALQKAPVVNGITILRLDFANVGFAQDFLVLQNPSRVPDLLVIGGNPVRKVQFYGSPQRVELLADMGEWMGGGDKSKFWGTNHPDLREILRRLGIDE